MSHKLAKLIKYNKHNYQASKSASSKYLGRRLGDRPLLPSSIANVTTGTFAGLMLILSLPLFFSIGSAYASPYALSISFVDSSSNEDISSPVVEMNVAPSYAGTFAKSSTSTIGVGTTSSTGYTIGIAASDSTGNKLIYNDDNYLTSIKSATTEEQFKALDATSYNNMWGYLPSKWDSKDNTAFLPAPSTAGDILNSTKAANEVLNSTATDTCKRYNCDKYDITIGARVDNTMQIGTYSNTYVVYATANGTPYTITFKDNTVSNMPDDISSNSASSTVTIPNDLSKPARDGYTFIGWCSTTPTNNANGTDTCSGTTYQNGSTWNITEGTTVNNLTLYAMWSGNYTITALTSNGNTLYMQDFATMSTEKKAKVISSMTTGTAYTVKDNRGDKDEYKIAKLKDGNIWMLDNLRLGGTAAIKLTPSDTNIDKSYNLPASTTTGYTTYTEAKINTTYKNTVADTHYGVGSGKIGVYYNYCAISAGTYCYAAGAGVDVADTIVDSPQDICPAGWRLPTGGTTGDFQNLYGYYAPSGTAPSDANSLFVNLSLTLSGAYYENDRVYYNSEGWFPTSTYYNGNAMYRLLVYSSGNINPARHANRYDGWTVRCVMQ